MDEKSLEVDDHFGYFEFVFSVIMETLANVLAVFSDNENTNKDFAKRVDQHGNTLSREDLIVFRIIEDSG